MRVAMSAARANAAGRRGSATRGRGAATRGRGNEANGVTTRGSKGQNYVPEEERQLIRSVLSISQDPIVGNQQRDATFWERIGAHYEEHRPVGMGFRGTRSLESKWGQIKHGLSKFIGVFQQVQGLHPNGRSAADLLQMSRDLWRTKSQKITDFMFEHCWLLVKDFPRWADGWSTGKQVTPQKRSGNSIQQESSKEGESGSIIEESLEVDGRAGARVRPSGCKAAKEKLKNEKIKEGAGYAQAAAQQIMAQATVRKVAQMEEHNSIMLMTLPSRINSPEAQEYLRLRQTEELKKLRKKLAEEERLEQEQEAEEIRHAEHARAAREAALNESGQQVYASQEVGRGITGRARQDVDEDFLSTWEEQRSLPATREQGDYQNDGQEGDQYQDDEEDDQYHEDQVGDFDTCPLEADSRAELGWGLAQSSSQRKRSKFIDLSPHFTQTVPQWNLGCNLNLESANEHEMGQAHVDTEEDIVDIGLALNRNFYM